MQQAAKDRVLVVDDEPQVLVALEDLLSDDYVVIKAQSGESALSMLEKEPSIAAVVTDQRMPRMNGDELLSRMSSTNDATRIMLTGFADLTAVVRAVNEGRIFAYVTKPWNRDELKLKVQHAVDRWRLARELASERQLLHDLMDNIPDGIAFKDRDLRFIRANVSAARQLGLNDPAPLIGKRVSEIAGAIAAATDEADEQVVIERGVASLDRVMSTTQDGKRVWYSHTRAPIRGHDGVVVGSVSVSRDITQRKETEEALRVSEGRLQSQTALLNSILNSMEEGVIVADRAGSFIMFNRQAAGILGKPGDQTSVADWAQVFGLYLSDRVTALPSNLDPLACAIAGEELAEMEVCVRNDVIHDAIVAITAAPLRDAAGEVTGGVVVLRDVTEQRNLQQMLTQSQKMEAIGRLAGGVAHDFNNLLVVIDSYGDMMMHTFDASDQRREDLQQMLEASRRASALTKQLLAFSRRQLIQPKLVVLNDIVSGIEKMLRRIIGEHIDLVTTLASDLFRVRVDIAQLEQIIVNLTVNARDAMPEGGRLSLRTANVLVDSAHEAVRAGLPEGRYVLFEVQDTGVGMSAETQQRIFEPFFTTKAPDKGTGLGLATVYGVVKQSAGHISVRAEVNVGTAFSIYLPAVDQEIESAYKTLRSERPATSTGTILLVEDDDAVRRVTLRVLLDAGFRVLEARRAQDARDLCAKHGPSIDLMLVDVVMPNTSGPKLVEELTAIYPRMRVLFMSGYTKEAVQVGVNPDVDALFIEKPFTPRALIERVQETLATSARAPTS